MIGSKTRGNCLRMAAICGTLVVSSTSVVSVAMADNAWQPKVKHFALLSREEDCSIYSSLATRTELNLQESAQRLAASIEELKRRRTALESCARDKGLGTLGTDSSEMKAANLCPFEFREWVEPAFKMQADQMEVSEAEKNLDEIKLLIHRRCPTILVNSPF